MTEKQQLLKNICEQHFDRLYQASLAGDFIFVEDIMYGDHMLATLAYTGLCMLEKDETLLAKYRKGYIIWCTPMGQHSLNYAHLSNTLWEEYREA